MAIIRKCTEIDLIKLHAFAVGTFQTTFGPNNDPEHLNLYIQKAMNLDQFKREFKQSGSTFYLLEDRAELIGYLKLNFAPDQSDLNDPLSLEIERIYLHDHFQGKGYGKQLLDFAVKIAVDFQFEFIWLGVWERNFKALNFYYKHGFVKFDQHPFKLGADDQLDYLLRLDLPKKTNT